MQSWIIDVFHVAHHAAWILINCVGPNVLQNFFKLFECGCLSLVLFQFFRYFLIHIVYCQGDLLKKCTITWIFWLIGKHWEVFRLNFPGILLISIVISIEAVDRKSSVKKYWESSRRSMMELFAKLVNG